MVQQQDVHDTLEQATTTSHLEADKSQPYTTNRARHRVSVLVLLRAVLVLTPCQATRGMAGERCDNCARGRLA